MRMPFILKKCLVRSGLARFLPAVKRYTDGEAGMVRYFSDRVLAAPVEDFLDPAVFPRAHSAGVISLNEPSAWLDRPSGVGRLTSDRSGYPPARGYIELRTAIADEMKQAERVELDAERQVLVTHGATASYAAVLDAVVNAGQPVVLFAPCSPMFSLGAKSRRANIRWVPTRTEAGRIVPDARVLSRAMRGAKLIAFSDPVNPTGATFPQELIDDIVYLACRHDVLIYADKTFSRYRFDGLAARLSETPQARQRAFWAGSIPTGENQGAGRVGWLCGPSALISACTMTANLSAPFVPTILQATALKSICWQQDMADRQLNLVRTRRQYVWDRLQSHGLPVELPNGGLFFWVDVSELGLTGREFAERLLNEEQVLVGPGSAFGPGCEAQIRISFGADEGRLREGLNRLGRFMERVRKGEPAPSTPAIMPRLEPTSRAASFPMEPALGSDRPPSFSRV